MTRPKQPSIDPLVIGISSRALFDLAESHQVYEEEGLAAYQQYQIARESEPLEPGDAFSLVQKLLRLNDSLEESPVQVILLSRNSAD
ncbi:MAG: 5'-nucleotidase, partial [Gammaproteobacteria bacterium]|nr:5'-nucleotidase [Gammaproteobacteria bacterium]